MICAKTNNDNLTISTNFGKNIAQIFTIQDQNLTINNSITQSEMFLVHLPEINMNFTKQIYGIFKLFI